MTAHELIRATVSEVLKQQETAKKKSMVDPRWDNSGAVFLAAGERLLRLYPALRETVENGETYVGELRARSKDVVITSARVSDCAQTPTEAFEAARIRSYSRTAERFCEIEQALNAIRANDDFQLIVWRYFENRSLDEIAGLSGVSDKTARAHTRMLLERFCVALWGANAAVALSGGMQSNPKCRPEASG